MSPRLLEKQADAEKAWLERAQEIKDGTRVHLFDEFEQRGFVKDIVGWVKADMCPEHEPDADAACDWTCSKAVLFGRIFV